MPNDVVVPIGVVDRASAALAKVEERLRSLDRTQDRLGRTAERAATRSSRAWARVRGGLARVGQAGGRVFRGISTQLKSAIRFSMRWGTVLSGIVAAAIGLVARQGVSLNTQLEKYKITLQTILGSQAKANAMIEFIIGFAAKTPFQVDGLVETAVQLSAVGLSARRWLPLVGDLASAFGGSQEKVQQLVRALGLLRSGVAGEAFETLRRLGIAQREFEQRGIKFTAGRQLVSAPSEALAALEDIIKTRFGGLMTKLSGTFAGALSNIRDNISAVLTGTFRRAFLSAEKVTRRLLDTFDLLKNSGIVRAFQDTAGDAIANGFTRAVEEAEKLIGLVQATGGIGAAFRQLWNDIRPAARDFVRWFGAALGAVIKGVFLELIRSPEGRKVLAVGAVASPAGSALIGAGSAVAAGGVSSIIRSLIARAAAGGAVAGAGEAVAAGGAGAVAGGLTAPLSGTILGAGTAGAGAAAAEVAGGGLAATVATTAAEVAGVILSIPGLLVIAAGLAAKAGLEFHNTKTEEKLTAGAATRTPQADIIVSPAQEKQFRLDAFKNNIASQFGEIGKASVGLLSLTDPTLFKKITDGLATGTDAALEFREALVKIVGPEVTARIAGVQQQFLGLSDTLPSFAEKAQDSLDVVIGRLEGVGNKFVAGLLTTPVQKLAPIKSSIMAIDKELASVKARLGALGSDPANLIGESEKILGLAGQYNAALEKRGRLRLEELGVVLKVSQAEAKTASGLLSKFAGLGGRSGPSDKAKFIRDLDEAVRQRDKLRAGGRVDPKDIVRSSRQFSGLFSSEEVFTAIRKLFARQATGVLGAQRANELRVKILQTEVDAKAFERRKDQIIAESKLLGKGMTDAISLTTDRMKDELVAGFRIAGQAAIDKILAQLGPEGQDVGGRLAQAFASALALQLEEFEYRLKNKNNPTAPAGGTP